MDIVGIIERKGMELIKKFLFLVCFFLVLTACGVEESQKTPDKQNVTDGDKETITFTEDIVFDTLCFSSIDVPKDLTVKQKNGCTSDMEQISGILSRLDKISTKEPSSEEEIERMEAIANISNYQIYLSQGKTVDNNLYTITVYEDGIIQYDDEGLPGIAHGDISVEAYEDKYNEVKSLLYEFAESR